MEINDFIKNLADIFDDTPLEEFSPETRFHEIEEWSSLHALAALNMLEIKYSVKVNPNDMAKATTVQDLFNLVNSKK